MKSEPTSAGKEGGFYVTIATAAGSTTKKVEGDLLTVGRAEDCHLSIAHETLSRRHLSIFLKDGVCAIEDHGSANGTFVNGRRIKPHQNVRVLPEDKITMGQAGVTLGVSVEPVMRKEGPPVASSQSPKPLGDAGKPETGKPEAVRSESGRPEAGRPEAGRPESAKPDTIVTSTSHGRREQRKAVIPPPPKPKDEAQEQAEGMLQDAQRKAALMIQEAEIEAERRVEDIYLRAHETQAKMDEVYQRRMNEAYRASEALYQKSQEESQRILDAARSRSNEIRLQAESFVADLRRRTEEDCERMLEEAQQTARDLKEQRLLEAEDLIRKREQEVDSQIRKVMDERLGRFEEDLAKEAAAHRQELRIEMEEKREHIEADQKELTDHVRALREQLKTLTEEQTRERQVLEESRQQSQASAEEAGKLKMELDQTRSQVTQANQQMADLRARVAQEKTAADATSNALKTSQDTLARVNEEIRAAQARVKVVQDETATKILQLRAKFEDDKVALEKAETTHFEELKLQTTRKIHEMEMRLADELHDKQDRISREMLLTFETFLRNNPDPSARDVKHLGDEVTALLKRSIVSVSQDGGTKAQQASLIELKRRQKWKTALLGALTGIACGLVGEHVYLLMQSENSPMARRVAAAQEERAADLAQRKYDPPMSTDYKSTYVENVVKTTGFVTTYTSDDFQKKFMKALTPYMLKTWKVDEDKTFQVIGIASSLVTLLSQKRANIHPDFVEKQLSVMRTDETDAINRMRTLLGSQVRVESFKKFEKQFYETYQP